MLSVPMALPSYAKVLPLGHAMLENLLKGRVEITEKVDGSCARFGNFGGSLRYGSHHVNFSDEQPVDEMFLPGWQYLETIADRFEPNVVYFAEYLKGPHQSTISYSRAPTNHFMLFDIYDANLIRWRNQDEIRGAAIRLGIDPPNILWEGPGETLTQEQLNKLLETQSYLGGSVIEGVVLKNREATAIVSNPHDLRMPPHPPMGKLVRESFKETNRVAFKKDNPVESAIAMVQNKARWEKAVLALRDRGELSGELRDIALLIPEVQRDVELEAKADILELFWQAHSREILKGAVRGLPDFYKGRLAEQQFVRPHTPKQPEG